MVKKKKSLDIVLPTYKARVIQFWDWFSDNSQRFAAAIKNSGDSAAVAEEVSQKLDVLLPGMAWVFGPSDDQCHSFTLSGEGISFKQLLADYWLKHQREIPNWTFFASRQPSSTEDLAEMEITFEEGIAIDAKQMVVATTPDEEEQRINIVAWHPAFSQIDEENQPQLVFLLLDEALGEFGTEQCLGTIDIKPPPAGGKIVPLLDLPAYIESAYKYLGWERISPLEAYTTYTMSGIGPQPRGDTIAGTTLIPQLIEEFLDNEGPIEDPTLGELGAAIRYLKFSSDNIASGEEVSARSVIEDAIEAALMENLTGYTLGGAAGKQHSYIDIMLLDGELSIELVFETIKQFGLQGEVTLEPLL
jgi:hypothetical protein